MELKPGISIKKDKTTDEYLFIIEDSNVTWIIHNNDDNYMELFCFVPSGWVSEIVAIQITPHVTPEDSKLLSGYERNGISAGVIGTGKCNTPGPINKILDKDELNSIKEEGYIIYNGSKYKLIM